MNAFLPDVLRSRAKTQREETAFTFLDQSLCESSHLTYGALDREAARIAARLLPRTTAGDRVLLAYPHGPQFIAALFGCWYAGVVPVPVVPARKGAQRDRFDAIARDADVSVILTPDEDAANASATADLDGLRPPGELALLQYTSGSTGNPKGVVVTHANILHNQQQIQRAFALDGDTVFVGWLPFHHDMGLIGYVLSPIFVGRPCVLMAPTTFLQSPLRWLETISKYRATTAGGPNFAYELCARKISAEQTRHLDLRSWRTAFNGAEPVRPATLDRFARRFESAGFNRARFYPCYGMAESTLFITGGDPSATPKVSSAGTHVGCGRTAEDTHLVIVDPHTHLECAAGSEGEIWVSGPSVAQGYWNKPELSAETFAAEIEGRRQGERFLRTGDLGVVEAGELYVTGRLKDLVVVRGQNHHAEDIEATVLAAHEALRPAGAAAFSVDAGGEERVVVVAEIERTQLRNGDHQTILSAIRHAVFVEHGLQIAEIRLLKPSSLPKTSSGKVQRAQCRLRHLAGELDAVVSWNRDSGSLEVESLRNHIAEALGVAPMTLDPQTALADYGLDSATAVRLAASLGDVLGKSVSPTVFYEHPNIASLIRHFSAAEPQQALRPESNDRSEHAIAIVGIGCRFPQARGPAAFFELLREGIDAVSEVPHDRFPIDPARSHTRRGAFLDAVDQFDASFFGISAREARVMDPQQRLLLELAWEALEHAYLDADVLRGSRTGVFVGISNSEYATLDASAFASPDAYFATGNALSIAANRLSYFFDFRGPSLAIDTACSSSLVAVHQACQSLNLGECDLALAGGVSIMLSEKLFVAMSQARMLAADGRCKTFDAAADGYGRGEGGGLVVLKRLDDALRAGDDVLAIIRGSAVNQDGKSNGLTAPNGAAQEEVIRRALANARVDRVDLIEAHGTGTGLGDPIELNALKAVFAEKCTDEEPLFVGSVKTNIGHLEAAAGIAGLVKAALALRHGYIPRHLHLSTLNPLIDLSGTHFEIPREGLAWVKKERARCAGVSSFGFGGTNAHVVLEEAPQRREETVEIFLPTRSLLLVSAKSEAALQTRARALAEVLQQTPTEALPKVAAATQTRAHQRHRLAVSGNDPLAIARRLRQGRPSPAADRQRDSAPRIAFLFTGQGAQRREMGRALYEGSPHCKRTLDWFDQLFSKKSPGRLLSALFAADDERLAQTEVAQPALFALEWALRELWQSLGITPVAVLGHSLGEYVAACAAGVVGIEEMFALVIDRGIFMQSTTPGKMAAAFATREIVAEALAGLEDRVAIAGVNGATNVVVSGEQSAVDETLARLQRRGVDTQYLQATRAFHSPLMNPIFTKFEERAATLAYRTPTIPLVSNITGRVLPAVDAAYWARHLRVPVEFAAGLETLVSLGVDTFLELGPDAVLTRIGRRSSRDPNLTWLSSLEHGRPDWEILLGSLGSLYEQGAEVKVERPAGRSCVQIPTCPFQRKRHWITDAEHHDVVHHLQWQPAPRSERPDLFGAIQKHELTPAEHDAVVGYRRVLGELENESAAIVARTLHTLGVDSPIDAGIDPIALAQKLGVVPRQRQLFNRMLRAAGEQPATQQFGLEACGERRLLERCGNALPEVLRGAVDPLELLFPHAGDIYSNSVGAKLMNDRIRRAILAALEKTPPGKKLRILEIGAGTGGTTSGLLEVLPADRVEYVFTDVSPLFLSQAKALFGQSAFVSFEKLDIERAPASQGFGGRQFDVVIASNVLHATARLGHSLEHIHGLLRPGGVMLLLEITTPLCWIDLTFGLTEGWWRFADRELRRDHPLLSPQAWTSLLQQSGFPEVRALSAGLEQTLFVAARALVPSTLIVADPSPLARGVEEQFRARAVDFTTIRPDETPPAQRFANVLVLCEPGADTLGDAHRNAQLGMRLTTKLIEQGGASSFWCVSRVSDLSSSTLWATALTARLEHPAISVHHIRLPVRALADEAEAIFKELSSLQEETEIALDGARRETRRLVAEHLQDPRSFCTLDPAKSYLITGAAGGLGRLSTRWLIDKGARHLLLMSRRGLDADVLDDLTSRGATVTYVRGDISDRKTVNALLQEHSLVEFPLGGVIHAAGVLDDGIITQLDDERLRRVMAPKVDGAWHLHQATQGSQLDFFVLFSSAASLLGSAGQANHAAANAFMDALAHHRRERGLPALSINWGPWAGVGAAAERGAPERLRASGFDAIEPEAGLRIFERLLLDRTHAQVGVLGLRTPEVVIAPRARAQSEGGLHLAVLAAPRDSRGPRTVEYVRAIAAELLGQRPIEVDPETSLQLLGFDSLMAVELRNRLLGDLAVDLPLRSLIESPRIVDLAEVIVQRIEAVEAVSSPVLEPPRLESPIDIVETMETARSVDASQQEGPFPLSSGQQALWFMHRLAPASAAYNVVLAGRLAEEIDQRALTEAFRELIARHEMLRTRFSDESGSPVQEVGTPRVQIEMYSRSADVEQTIAEFADQPFDLRHGPSIRLGLIDPSTLMLCAHHISVDFRALEIIFSELCLLYRARSEGRELKLAASSTTYRDFVIWQAAFLESDAGRKQREHWTRVLADRPPELNLATDRPRPQRQTYAGAAHPVTLDAELSEAVRRLARENQLTTYVVLLAAFEVLIAGESGQSDFLLGSPASGRTRPEFADVVGCFANPLVLRARAGGDPKFIELAREVKGQVIDALENQDLPFPLLVEALQPKRDPSRSPLFQVSFVLDQHQRGARAKSSRVVADELLHSKLLCAQRGADFDLILTMFDTDAELAGRWEYNVDLFQPATIERMQKQFRRLLTEIVADPEQRIGALLGRGPRRVLAEVATIEAAVSMRERLQDGAVVVLPDGTEIGARAIENRLRWLNADSPAPDAGAADAGVRSRPKVVETITTIWKEVLKLDHVEPAENFFDLGGHSLLAAQVISRVNRALGVDLQLQSFFDQPTIAGLATAVHGATGGEVEELTRTIKEMSPEMVRELLARKRREREGT